MLSASVLRQWRRCRCLLQYNGASRHICYQLACYCCGASCRYGRLSNFIVRGLLLWRRLSICADAAAVVGQSAPAVVSHAAAVTKYLSGVMTHPIAWGSIVLVLSLSSYCHRTGEMNSDISCCSSWAIASAVCKYVDPQSLFKIVETNKKG